MQFLEELEQALLRVHDVHRVKAGPIALQHHQMDLCDRYRLRTFLPYL
jgi:hypothetical protein